VWHQQGTLYCARRAHSTCQHSIRTCLALVVAWSASWRTILRHSSATTTQSKTTWHAVGVVGHPRPPWCHLTSCSPHSYSTSALGMAPIRARQPTFVLRLGNHQPLVLTFEIHNPAVWSQMNSDCRAEKTCTDVLRHADSDCAGAAAKNLSPDAKPVICHLCQVSHGVVQHPVVGFGPHRHVHPPSQTC
jgi:hypothetical protein